MFTTTRVAALWDQHFRDDEGLLSRSHVLDVDAAPQGHVIKLRVDAGREEAGRLKQQLPAIAKTLNVRPNRLWLVDLGDASGLGSERTTDVTLAVVDEQLFDSTVPFPAMLPAPSRPGRVPIGVRLDGTGPGEWLLMKDGRTCSGVLAGWDAGTRKLLKVLPIAARATLPVATIVVNVGIGGEIATATKSILLPDSLNVVSGVTALIQKREQDLRAARAPFEPTAQQPIVMLIVDGAYKQLKTFSAAWAHLIERMDRVGLSLIARTPDFSDVALGSPALLGALVRDNVIAIGPGTDELICPYTPEQRRPAFRDWDIPDGVARMARPAQPPFQPFALSTAPAMREAAAAHPSAEISDVELKLLRAEW